MRAITTLILLFCSVTLSTQEKITLLFTGDLMQHREQIEAAHTNNGNYNYDYCFSRVKSIISSADIAIGNLELVIGGAPYTGYPSFSAPVCYLQALKNAGYDILLTGNNHCLDRRKRGLERTISMLDSLHIAHAGTYRNKGERENHYPLFYRHNNFGIAFLNYTYATNGIPVNKPNIVNYIDTAIMLKDIAKALSFNPDAIIACMHWGDEYISLPNGTQKRLASWLLSHGVTHIIGTHPHVVQPIEIVTDQTGKEHVVAYSLGNFISGMTARNTDGGIILQLTLHKDNNSCKISDCHYRLVWVGRPTLTGTSNYRLYLIGDHCDSLSHRAYKQMSFYGENTRRLLGKYNKGVNELPLFIKKNEKISIKYLQNQRKSLSLHRF